MSGSPFVVIRVDSSFFVGSGHLMRCSTLADSLKRYGCEVCFICQELPGNLNNVVEQKGYSVHVVSENNVFQTIEVLKKLPDKPDWLVVDHYELNNRWETAVRPYVKQLFVIDDLANRKHDCDLLLDQTFGRAAKDYETLVPLYCRLLLGSEYAMIAPAFSKLKVAALRRREQQHSVSNILVNMGGTDPGNVTRWVIDAIGKSTLNIPANVVLGSRALHRDAVKASIATLKDVTLYENVSNFPEMLAKADLAIGAGGSSSWERCCLGLPTLMLAIAENQLTIARRLNEVGAVRYLGQPKEVTVESLNRVLRDFVDNPAWLRQMAHAASKICDGYGVERVVMELFPPLAKDGSTIRLRPATMSDAMTMLAWQQDPSTRQYARNSHAPTKTEHLQWLEQRLSNANCIFNIILYKNNPAGVLRLDRILDAENAYEISIFSASPYRRLGLSTAALHLARTMFPDVELRAVVLDGNDASRALFLSAGYHLQGGMYVNIPNPVNF